MPEAVLAGTRIYWRVDGTGARDVFLIHCTMAHSGAWKGLFPYLADDCRMVSFDMPGHGRSGLQDKSVSWQTHTTNQAGRTLYEKVAQHHGFIVYSHDI